jgi:hypothetical protein
MNNSHQQPAGCGHGVHLGWSWILIALAVTLSVLLWQGHRVHLLAAIPYLILLSCPLMHLLHRHGRRRQGDHDHGRA